MNPPLLATLLALPALPALPARAQDPASRPMEPKAPATRASVPLDPHSYSRPNEVRTQHLLLQLTLDFEKREVHGKVTHRLERRDRTAPLLLDAKGLTIESVAGRDGTPRRFELGKEDATLGAPLSIALEPGDEDVTVAWRTSPQAEALQWLEPAQTAGKQKPFLFTQGQAILTRTWIPLQDTPGNRITYSASVKAPRELVPRMAAEDGAGDGTAFSIGTPIPPYLIALACGDLHFRAVSERCGVWAEAAVVEKARSEFADMESMVAAAEKLFGPYRWGRYDVLVLPPAFPFGGMENPCLTFATPTVLAGDRSLVSLIAHELAHSWSGNLVTNATWSDFWLNEGFTVYCEHRIMEALYGAERATMETLIGLMTLADELKTLPPQDQVLHIDLRGRNPDDAMTAVAYDKGAWFLSTCERVLGRERLDPLLRKWFDGHAFQSVTTEQLERFLVQELPDPALRELLQVRRWLHEPGIPDNALRPESPLFAAVDAVVQQVARTRKPPDAAATKGWVTQQWLRFLNGLPDDLSAAELKALDERFGFTKTGNCEIACVWLRRAIRHRYDGADARLEEFVREVGRRKLLKPLYEELCKTDAGRAKAKELYARARSGYHAVTTRTLDAIVLGKQ